MTDEQKTHLESARVMLRQAAAHLWSMGIAPGHIADSSTERREVLSLEFQIIEVCEKIERFERRVERREGAK